MPFPNATSNVLAKLTSQGRNLLARSAAGLVSFTLEGFSVGRGGYDMVDPTQAIPIVDDSTPALGHISITDNDLATLTTVTINGLDFIADVTSAGSVGTQWDKGVDDTESALNLATAINKSFDIRVKNIVKATANVNTVTIDSLILGAVGNTIVLETTFFDHIMLNMIAGVSPAPLHDGFDQQQLDKVFPNPVDPTALNDIEPIDLIEQPIPQVISAVCRLDLTEANFGIGEYALWVKVIQSTVASEIGKFFLYASVHQPIVAKTLQNVHITRIITTY